MLLQRPSPAVYSWANRFGLTANPSKCQAIIQGSNRLVSKLNSITIPLIIVNGVVTLVKERFISQFAGVLEYRKANNYWLLQALYRLKNVLSFKIWTTLAQIFLIIHYSDLSYNDLNADLGNKYNWLENHNCICFTTYRRKYVVHYFLLWI